MTLDDLDAELAATFAYRDEVGAPSRAAGSLARHYALSLRMHWRQATACGDDPEHCPDAAPRRVP